MIELPIRWAPLDLSKPPAPPEWKVKDFLASGWVTVFHGRPGSGKSMLYQSLIGATMANNPWLGRDVEIERILVLDEENPIDIAIARLKAAGYVHERDQERLLYFDQIGCRLGDPTWNQELLEIARSFKPCLVVVDSMFAATNATWSNDTINPLFAEVFKPLARLGSAVWLNHHDRKAGGDIEDRASGGDQWTAQIDRQIAIEKLARGAQPQESEDDSFRLSFPIKLEGGKSRQGVSLPEMYLSVKSKAALGEPDLPLEMWLEIGEIPSTPKDGDGWRPTNEMTKIEKVLASEPGLSFNGIYKAIGGGKSYVRRALDVLIEDESVLVENGPRGAQLHRLNAP